jgi:hypothetical protein
MSEPEFDKDDPVWKALDAFKGVEPHPQSRARFWAVIARGEAAEIARGEAAGSKVSGIRWLVRFVLPAAGFACAVIALAVGGTALIRQHQADREIAENIELYEDLEVIQNIAQLASYEEQDEDFDELVK